MAGAPQIILLFLGILPGCPESAKMAQKALDLLYHGAARKQQSITKVIGVTSVQWVTLLTWMFEIGPGKGPPKALPPTISRHIEHERQATPGPTTVHCWRRPFLILWS